MKRKESRHPAFQEETRPPLHPYTLRMSLISSNFYVCSFSYKLFLASMWCLRILNLVFVDTHPLCEMFTLYLSSVLSSVTNFFLSDSSVNET